jgi:hypothetical protein
MIANAAIAKKMTLKHFIFSTRRRIASKRNLNYFVCTFFTKFWWRKFLGRQKIGNLKRICEIGISCNRLLVLFRFTDAFLPKTKICTQVENLYPGRKFVRRQKICTQVENFLTTSKLMSLRRKKPEQEISW